MPRTVALVLAAATLATSVQAGCGQTSEWLRRQVIVEAASQSACKGYARSKYRDLGFGAVKRVAKEVDVSSCHFEILTAVAAVKDEMAVRGKQFCGWADAMRAEAKAKSY